MILNISKLIQLNNFFQCFIMLQCLLNGIYTIIVGIKYILPNIETSMLTKLCFKLIFINCFYCQSSKMRLSLFFLLLFYHTITSISISLTINTCLAQNMESQTIFDSDNYMTSIEITKKCYKSNKNIIQPTCPLVYITHFAVLHKA